MEHIIGHGSDLRSQHDLFEQSEPITATPNAPNELDPDPISFARLIGSIPLSCRQGRNANWGPNVRRGREEGRGGGELRV